MVRAPLFLVVVYFVLLCGVHAGPAQEWSESERAMLEFLWIGNLPELPPDPTNRYADDPAAARLGERLFFDKRLSANGEVSCASCHLPQLAFTDGLARARGIGEASRSAPSLLGIAHSPWFFWDGRSDSQWSQALGPLESPVEHGGYRSRYIRVVYDDPVYRSLYEDIFGPLPDLSDEQRFPPDAAPYSDGAGRGKWRSMSAPDRKAVTRAFVNLGKSIAAYERSLLPGASRFDRYVQAIRDNDQSSTDFLDADEIAGLKLFIGKAMCVTCHQGPLFTNHGFHNIGVPDQGARDMAALPRLLALIGGESKLDMGRYDGIRAALESEFNCLGEYSDAEEDHCAELKFASRNYGETMGAFKVPTLRNIALTAPYMHGGQFTSLAEVLEHYNAAPRAQSGKSELISLGLTKTELRQLEAFLLSLTQDR